MTRHTTSTVALGEELETRKSEDETLRMRLAVSLQNGDTTVIHEAWVTVHIDRRKRRQIGERWS